MSRLLLLRHAKAGWAEPGTRDFDRDLEPSGREDAAAMGRAMGARNLIPDLVLCSTAKRAHETWTRVAPSLGVSPDKIVMTERLYSADASGYVEIVRRAQAADMILVVGHNPMLEDVAFALAAHGDETARQALSTGFPTAGLVVVGFETDLSAIAPGAGTLEAFFSPADLRL